MRSKESQGQYTCSPADYIRKGMFAESGTSEWVDFSFKLDDCLTNTTNLVSTTTTNGTELFSSPGFTSAVLDTTRLYNNSEIKHKSIPASTYFNAKEVSLKYQNQK